MHVYSLVMTENLFISEGQPESIVQDIEMMVRSYVEKVIEVQLTFCKSPL